MAGVKGLPDQSARITALTEHERSLLVEAGAGSGKTSIMAGRVAMLFARASNPNGSPQLPSPNSPRAN
jgi:superfamily I DNA/RNA helicase